jgi:transcriptional regulator with XRE-family HTH domain
MFSRIEFGEKLRQERIHAGESQQALAELLGVGKTQVSELENGKTTTTFERLVLLCEHYHVSADYLLGLSDKKERTI